MLLTHRTTSCRPRCLEPPPADINMHFPSAPPLCCIYLQAVPCDPAGADFNFAALSFNSKFLHQIHLIPLHPHSLSERQRTFNGFRRGKNVARGLKEKKLGGGKRERSLSQLSLSSARRCAVIYDTLSLSLSLARPTLPPSIHPPHLSLSLSCKLSLRHWCVLI